MSKFEAKNFDLQKLKQRDSEEFKAFILNSSPVLRAFLSRQIWDKDVISDLCQDIYLAIWDSLDRLEENANLLAWMIGIARNHMRNYYRSMERRTKAKQHYQEHLLQLLDQDVGIILNDQLDPLKKCVQLLPEKSFVLLQERYVGLLSVKQLARKYSKSANAISQLLFRTRMTLKSCIEKA